MAINTFSGGNPINSLQAAGKNKILNSDFSIWQRGTSFSNPASAAFTADRWSVVWDGSGATRTVSQQTFTPGTAPVTGYEGAYFYRFNQSVAGTSGTYNLFQNRMEDVRTFAGQTVTISFWGKAAATTNLVKLNFEQEFGTGGSPSANVSTDIASTNFTLTTSWQRFTVTTTVPSISGKTVGTTTPGYLGLRFWVPVNSTFTIDIWGVQVELGTTATTFTTATGTIQGEIAACERYFQKNYDLTENPGTTNSNAVVWTQIEGSETSRVLMNWRFQTRMRTAPTMVFYSTSTGSSGKVFSRSANADRNITSYSAGQTGITYNTIDGTNSAGQQILVLYTASAEL